MKIYSDIEFRRFHAQRHWLRSNGYEELVLTETFKDCITTDQINDLVCKQDILYIKARNHNRLTKAFRKAGIPLEELKERYKI